MYLIFIPEERGAIHPKLEQHIYHMLRAKSLLAVMIKVTIISPLINRHLDGFNMVCTFSMRTQKKKKKIFPFHALAEKVLMISK